MIIIFFFSYNAISSGSVLSSEFASLFNKKEQDIHLEYENDEENRKYFEKLLKGLKKLEYLKIPSSKKLKFVIVKNEKIGYSVKSGEKTLYDLPINVPIEEALFLFSKVPASEPVLQNMIKESYHKREEALKGFLSDRPIQHHLLLANGVCDLSNRVLGAIRKESVFSNLQKEIASTLNVKPNEIEYTITSKADGVYSNLDILAFKSPNEKLFFITQSLGLFGLHNLRTHLWQKKGKKLFPISQVVYNYMCQPIRIITFENDDLKVTKRISVNLDSKKVSIKDFQPNYKLDSNPCMLPRIDLPGALAVEKVIVAIIEDGFEYTLPDFKGRLLVGWDFEENDPYPFSHLRPFRDDNKLDHGAAVASIYLENRNVDILPVKVSGGDTVEIENAIYGGKTFKELESAMDFAVLKGARIINISAGDDKGYHSLNFYRRIAEKAKLYPNVFFVIAAGNTSQDLDSPFNLKAYIKGVRDLTNLINVYMVASVDKNGKLSIFSSYGNKLVSIGALGENIKVLNIKGERVKESGTSFATPNLGLLISKLLTKMPNLVPLEVRKIIYDTSSLHPSLIGKVESAGYLNPQKALNALSSKEKLGFK